MMKRLQILNEHNKIPGDKCDLINFLLTNQALGFRTVAFIYLYGAMSFDKIVDKLRFKKNDNKFEEELERALSYMVERDIIHLKTLEDSPRFYSFRPSLNKEAEFNIIEYLERLTGKELRKNKY